MSLTEKLIKKFCNMVHVNLTFVMGSEDSQLEYSWKTNLQQITNDRKIKRFVVILISSYFEVTVKRLAAAGGVTHPACQKSILFIVASILKKPESVKNSFDWSLNWTWQW